MLALAASLAAPSCGTGAPAPPGRPLLSRDTTLANGDARAADARGPGEAPASRSGREADRGAQRPDHAPPFSWPLRGQITSPFGPSKTRTHHAGIDISGDERDPIRAAASGRVSKVADDPRYGLMLVIEHGGGYATWYGHTSALLVGKGDTVSRGQPIALVGDTGNAHGTHLHFEIRGAGRPVNPVPLLE